MYFLSSGVKGLNHGCKQWKEQSTVVTPKLKKCILPVRIGGLIIFHLSKL